MIKRISAPNAMKSIKSLAIVTHEMNQYAFEFAMHRCLEFGDESRLAEMAGGKAPSYYSQMLNPHDPRESIWFRAARDFQNLMKIDPDRGCEALQIFTEFVKQALPNEKLCADRETGQLAKETADVTNARINKLPIEDQLREARENKLQAEKTYESIYLEWCEVNSANNGSHK